MQVWHGFSANQLQWHWGEVETFLGAFGAERPKAIVLSSNRLWMHSLKRDLKGKRYPVPAIEENGIATTQVNHDGTKSITGCINLKKTQTYPQQFGEALFLEWDKHEWKFVRQATLTLIESAGLTMAAGAWG